MESPMFANLRESRLICFFNVIVWLIASALSFLALAVIKYQRRPAAITEKTITIKARLFALFLAATKAIFFLLCSLSSFIRGANTSCVSSTDLPSSRKKYFCFSTSMAGRSIASFSFKTYFVRYPSSVINLSSTNAFTGFA